VTRPQKDMQRERSFFSRHRRRLGLAAGGVMIACAVLAISLAPIEPKPFPTEYSDSLFARIAAAEPDVQKRWSWPEPRVFREVFTDASQRARPIRLVRGALFVSGERYMSFCRELGAPRLDVCRGDAFTAAFTRIAQDPNIDEYNRLRATRLLAYLQMKPGSDIAAIAESLRRLSLTELSKAWLVELAAPWK
jgi:hypothetical protein